MSWRSIQHKVFGAGGGDDPGREENVDDRLQQQEDLGWLQVRTVCRSTINS